MQQKIDPGALARECARAAERIRPAVRRTPLIASGAFSKDTGADVRLKLENLQETGSFKLRGASNRLMTLPRGNGTCVAASSGNHGAGVACAARKLGMRAIVFVPEQTSPLKVDAIRHYGAELRFFGTDGLDTEIEARRYASDEGYAYVSPYNDADVIAGQGTCAVEIAEELDGVDAIFVAVGGGGLIGGTAAVLKSRFDGVRVIGCQPEASPVMARSIEAGRILELPSGQTLSDGTAGGIEPDSVTFGLCRQLVDEFVLVSEEEISDAMRRAIDAERQLIEGSAAVALAALLRHPDIRGSRAVVLVCGGNVSRDTLRSIL